MGDCDTALCLSRDWPHKASILPRTAQRDEIDLDSGHLQRASDLHQGIWCGNGKDIEWEMTALYGMIWKGRRTDGSMSLREVSITATATRTSHIQLMWQKRLGRVRGNSSRPEVSRRSTRTANTKAAIRVGRCRALSALSVSSCVPHK